MLDTKDVSAAPIWTDLLPPGAPGDLTIRHLRLQAEAVEPIRIPPFAGAAFRGAFGFALRRVACVAVRRTECGGCPVESSCLYTTVFDGVRRSTVPRDVYPKLSPSPHPFVLRPPRGPAELAPGDAFSFDLILFGWAGVQAPYLVEAFRRAGRRGIGAPRGRFELRGIEAIESSEEPAHPLDPNDPIPPFRLGDLDRPLDGPITLQLLSPLRVREDRRLRDELPFALVARNAVRRVAYLLAFHQGRALSADFRALADAAASIETLASDLRWVDPERYSRRQGRALRMGGMVGSVTYAPPPAAIAPYLRLLPMVHVGKGTAFGHGRIEIGEEAGP